MSLQPNDAQLAARFHAKQRVLNRAKKWLFVLFFASFIPGNTNPPMIPTTVGLIIAGIFAVFIVSVMLATRCPKCDIQLWPPDDTEPYPKVCPGCGLRLG
jgi:hypothetical protein